VETEPVSFHPAHLRAYFLVPGKSKVGDDISDAFLHDSSGPKQLLQTSPLCVVFEWLLVLSATPLSRGRGDI